MKQYWYLLICLLSYSLSVHGQGQPSVEIDPLVNVTISEVRTDSFPLIEMYVKTNVGKGMGLPSFGQEAFQVSENNEPQEIFNFSPIENRTISYSILLVDHSQEMGEIIRNEDENFDENIPQTRLLHAEAASMILLGALDNRYDSLMLLGFARDIDMITEMDANVTQIASVYNQMEVVDESPALYDALGQALGILGDKKGQKNIYIITTGESGISNATPDSLANLAIDHGVQINIAALGSADTLNLKDLTVKSRGFYQYAENVFQLRSFFEQQLKPKEKIYRFFYRSSISPTDTSTRNIRMSVQGNNIFLANGLWAYQPIIMEDSLPSETIAFDLISWWPQSMGEWQALLEAYGLYAAAILAGLILLFILLRVLRKRADANLIVPAITKMPEEVSKNSMRVRLASPYKDKPSKFTIYSAGGKPIKDFVFRGTKRRARIKLKELPDGTYKCDLANGGHLSESRSFRLNRNK